MARFLLAAAHKSSGKTVISTGIAAAFQARGQTIQCFKKGPDYIDPMWLTAASGRPCYNLDFNTMSGPEILALLAIKGVDSDVSMIEANKGLFDGVDLHGNDSNAELAKQMSTPVVLVIDTSGMTRGIAPLLLGYQAFDQDINIAGVILNKTGGTRHENKLRAAVETYTSLPVFGAVGRNPKLDIGERHLGLTTPAETGELDQKIQAIGRVVADSVDLNAITDIAKIAPPLNPVAKPIPSRHHEGIRIGVARDVCFGFYYPDDLEAFEALGATLVPFDSLASSQLPDIDGLFIGGGFPELRMKELSANQSLRRDIKHQIANGLPTYAECGGLMYLCRSMHWGDTEFPMCDVIQADAVMHPRPQGRGYTRFEQSSDHPWGLKGSETNAHEFHYARLENLESSPTFAMHITRGHGIDGKHDGIVQHNLLAGFIHMRNTAQNQWVPRFLNFVASHKRR